MNPVYRDDYPTCAKAFSTLRVYHQTMSPDEVTRRLRIQPSDIYVAEKAGQENSWHLCTEENVDSLDLRRHIDWLLDSLEPAKAALGDLRESGAELDVFCYWMSKSGHGGPTISVPQLRRLAEFELECGFDIYFGA